MPRLVNVKKSVMAADEEHASFIRSMMKQKGVLMINMIGSPGSGKTTLLEKLLPKLTLRCAVIEGDVATSRDAERIAVTGTPVDKHTRRMSSGSQFGRKARGYSHR